MRTKILGGLLAATAICALTAATAGAVVTSTPKGGRIGYLPLNGETLPSGEAPIHSTVPSGKPPLEWHGGPVMHSQTAYAIFWAPSGFSFPAGYTAAIEAFLKNVAADSGKSTNVYSVSAQYTDGTGRAAYDDSFGGSVVDTHAYPTSGTCAPYKGVFGVEYTKCISDQKMAAEASTVVTEQGWPHGLGVEYYVVLPPHAGNCFAVTGTECFDLAYCAYHSYDVSTNVVYANISYSPGDVAGCGVGEYPNGHSNGNVDDTLSSLSHEANESITDPTLEAWYDEKGFEDGDECRNTPFEEDYGSPLGGLEEDEDLFNQAIGSGHYYLQQEWSNNIEDCAQRVEPASPSISGPGQLAPGQSGNFNGSGSLSGETEIVAYGWEFGDGATANGESVSHAFAGPGTFPVTLTVEDEWGFRYSTSRQVSVVQPASGGGGAGTSTVIQSPSPTSRSAGGKALKCRKGFRRVRRHGKAVCVRAKSHHHRRHHR
jgi:hypothetical protein